MMWLWYHHSIFLLIGVLILVGAVLAALFFSPSFVECANLLVGAAACSTSLGGAKSNGMLSSTSALQLVLRDLWNHHNAKYYFGLLPVLWLLLYNQSPSFLIVAVLICIFMATCFFFSPSVMFAGAQAMSACTFIKIRMILKYTSSLLLTYKKTGSHGKREDVNPPKSHGFIMNIPSSIFSCVLLFPNAMLSPMNARSVLYDMLKNVVRTVLKVSSNVSLPLSSKKCPRFIFKGRRSLLAVSVVTGALGLIDIGEALHFRHDKNSGLAKEHFGGEEIVQVGLLICSCCINQGFAIVMTNHLPSIPILSIHQPCRMSHKEKIVSFVHLEMLLLKSLASLSAVSFGKINFFLMNQRWNYQKICLIKKVFPLL